MNVSQLHSLGKRHDLFVALIKIKYAVHVVLLVFVFLLITRQEELMGYFNGHPWRVARTRIRVIGVSFDIVSMVLIKGNELTE